MSWKDKLLPASFRGVPFKTTDDEATFGRRVQTHEYPNRDIPYTEDLGRTVRRDKITAYVVGDDYHEQRDRLIAAINAGGVGKLVHPQYGELDVCIDGDVTVRHSSTDGRMCTISFAFVEAGELSYPTAGVATAEKLLSSCDAVIDRSATAFSRSFHLDGLPDFVQHDVLTDAVDMLGTATNALDRVNSAIGDAGRLTEGDLSVLLTPKSAGMNLANQLQRLWRSGNALLTSSNAVLTKILNLSSITVDRNLAPRGVWKTDSKTTQQRTEQRNALAQIIRTTALTAAARNVYNLPQAPLATVKPLPVTHPAVASMEENETNEHPVTYEMLTQIRDVLCVAIDQEMLRVTDDALFLALNTLRTDVNRDIAQRLEQTEKTTLRTPTEVLPALVLAADWYDSATREGDITHRNPITHPGFVPITTLKVPIQ